ncbi:MAG: AAA-like domain-containing protein [Cyanobacteria bacterium P01_H01_bin.162]
MAFVSGGTVQAGGGVYVSRQADQELLALCRSSAFAYVLTPRQMGKSSLMVRTAEVLKEQCIRTATVDLTKIGTQLAAEAWYLGLLTTIARPLGLVRQLMPWWKAHQHLGVTQRFTEFVEEVLLTEIAEQVVIFIDEIDTTLNLDFTDDFFIAIRSFYLARAENPDFTRLSFVLFGVATPSDLIRNPQRTPFNIGQRVDLTDFTFVEAQPLANEFNLPEADSEQLLQWVMNWTGGHPYLTQRLCGALAEENRTDWTEFAVAAVVSRIFLGAASKQDTNLQFVRDMLTRRSPDLTGGLTVYRQVLQNRELVPDEEQSLVKSHLKLSGIVKRREDDAMLLVRNPIYREVFDRIWIREHLPVNWVKQLRKAAIVSGIIFSVGMVPLGAIAAYQWRVVLDQSKQLTKALGEAEVAREEAEQARQDEENQRQRAEHEEETATRAWIKTQAERDRADEARIKAVEAQQAETEQRQQAEQARAAEADQRLIAVRAKNQAETLAVAEAQQRRIAEEQRTLAEEQQTLAEQLALVAGLKEQSIRGQSYLDTARATEGLVLTMHATIESRSLPPDIPPEVAADVRAVTESALFEASEAVKERMIFRGEPTNFSATAFSPDDELMVSGDLDGNLRLWDMQGNQINDFSGFHEGAVVAIAFTADGTRIVSLGQNGIIKLWQQDGQLLEESKTTTNFEVLRASFSANGQTVIASLADGSIATKSLDDQDWQEWLIAEPQVRILNASLDENDTLVEAATSRLSGPQDRQSFTGNEGEIVSIEAMNNDLEFNLVVRDDSGDVVTQGSSPIYATLPADGSYEVTTTAVGENEEFTSEPYRLRVNRIQYDDEPIYQERGALESTDEIARGDRRQDVHRFQGQAGQEISIALTTEEFDPYLRLENSDGDFIQEETEYIAPNESTNLASSFLRIKLPEDGTYRIIVTPFEAPEDNLELQALEGSYELQVSAGEHIEPSILEISGQLQIPVSRGDSYVIEGEKEPPFRVFTSSDERFTPYLQLRDNNGEIVLQNYGELDGSILEDGTYQLEVISDSDTGGNYNLVVNPEKINDIDISPDGRYLATALSDGRIKLWNSEGALLGEVSGQTHQGEVLAVAFSADGQTVVSGGQDGTIRLWNLAGEAIRDPLRGHNGDVLAVEFSADNQRIVSSGRDGTIRLWSPEGRALGQPFRGHADRVTGIQFSHDGQHVISRGRDQTVRIWAADVSAPFQGHSGEVLDAAFSPDGKLIASSGADGTVRLWNLQGGQVVLPFVGHEANPDGFEGIYSIAFSPDGQRLASAGIDGTIRLWDLQGNQIGEAFIGHEEDEFGYNGIIDVTFSPDGQRLASSGVDGTIRLWDLQGNQIVEAFTGHEAGELDQTIVVGLAFSPDGQRLASSGVDGTIRLWDLQGNQIGEAFTGHGINVFFIAFSPDGQRIASAGEDRTVRLWNLEGEPVGSPFQGHEDTVWGVAFSPDGERLASSSFDGTIRLWDLQGNQIGPPLTGHGDIQTDLNRDVGQFGFNTVNGLSFSPDGQRIVSAGGDGTIRLWWASWEEWMRNACEQIQHHPILQSLDVSLDEEFQGITSEVVQACQARIWE